MKKLCTRLLLLLCVLLCLLCVSAWATETHTHDFTYTAKGDTITAHCTGGGKACDITEGLTLSIRIPTGNLVSNGSAKKASLTKDYNRKAFPDRYGIVYEQDGRQLTNAPVNAGRYTAKVTVGDATASVRFTIAKAAQKPPAAPVVTKTGLTSVTLKVRSGEEYSINGGRTWQKSGVFSGLKPGVRYSFVARRVENDNSKPSKASVPAKARTLSVQLSVNVNLLIEEKGDEVTVRWGKVAGATGYEVYLQYCGEDFEKTPTVKVNSGTTSVTLTQLNGKKLDTGKNVKAVLVVKKGGSVLGSSCDVHCAGSRATNLTDPSRINIAKTAYTLKKGKSVNIGAELVLKNPKGKTLPGKHAALLRYFSSDPAVATVNPGGKISARSPGVCTIQVLAINGRARTIQVTVK